MKHFAANIVSKAINNELGKLQTLKFANIQENNGYKLVFPDDNAFMFCGIFTYSITKDEFTCHKSRNTAAPTVPVKQMDTILFTMIGNALNCYLIAETEDCTVKMYTLEHDYLTGSELSNITHSLEEFEKSKAA